MSTSDHEIARAIYPSVNATETLFQPVFLTPSGQTRPRRSREIPKPWIACTATFDWQFDSSINNATLTSTGRLPRGRRVRVRLLGQTAHE